MATDPIPSTSFGKVIARYILVIGDTSADPDALPDVVPAVGEVVFTPKSTHLLYDDDPAAPGTIAYPKAVTGKLSASGELVDASGNPGVWLLTGVYSVKVSIVGVNTTPFDVTVTEAHGTTPLDLTRYTPIPIEPTVKFVVNQQVYTDTIAARDAAIAAAASAGGGSVGWVTVVTGDEARPNFPHVIWVGGTAAPASMADGDIWFSATAVVTPPDEEPASAPPVISTASLSALTQGQAFSQQLAATNSPTSWAITAGAIAGLSLSSTGLLSGTPSDSGAYSLTVGATNADGTGTKVFSGTITAATVEEPPTGDNITMFTAAPATPVLYTDGAPTIAVLSAFYYTGATKQIKGVRIYKPAGATVDGTWSAIVYTPGPGSWPDMAMSAPIQEKNFATLVDGWNDVLFDTPIDVPANQKFWIGYRNSIGQYLHAATAFAETAVPAPSGAALFLAETTFGNDQHRHYVRIDSQGVLTPAVQTHWYGTDVIVGA